MGVDESEEATELLKSIGDFERISDHAVNILESAEELRGKSLAFSAAAAREYLSLIHICADTINPAMSLTAVAERIQ